jgi:hypothetical protein
MTGNVLPAAREEVSAGLIDALRRSPQRAPGMPVRAIRQAGPYGDDPQLAPGPARGDPAASDGWWGYLPLSDSSYTPGRRWPKPHTATRSSKKEDGAIKVVLQP